MTSPDPRPAAAGLPLGNREVADRLEEVADLLEDQGANAFRVRAYRSAAHTLRGLKCPAHEILQADGLAGLRNLPGIGESLARSIAELTRCGRLRLLRRLRGHVAPEQLFMTLPGIGVELAGRIHERLGVASMPELAAAAYGGRLSQVPGLGPGRIRGILEALAAPGDGLTSGPDTRRAGGADKLTPVAELLGVDQEYRGKAAAGQLPCLAPLRYNPGGRAWLPVLHTHRGPRHYTALYSNTPRAHELGTTHDWVVIHRDDRWGRG